MELNCGRAKGGHFDQGRTQEPSSFSKENQVKGVALRVFNFVLLCLHAVWKKWMLIST